MGLVELVLVIPLTEFQHTPVIYMNVQVKICESDALAYVGDHDCVELLMCRAMLAADVAHCLPFMRWLCPHLKY